MVKLNGPTEYDPEKPKANGTFEGSTFIKNKNVECVVKVLRPVKGQASEINKEVENFKKMMEQQEKWYDENPNEPWSVIDIYKVIEDRDATYIVMQPFLECLKYSRLDNEGKKYSITQALDIILQLSKGIKLFNNYNLFHRDFNLNSVQVCFNSNQVPSFKLSDFRNLNEYDPNIHEIEMKIGDLEYMAPERLQSQKKDSNSYITTIQPTASSDVWILGVIAHLLLTGERLFDGKTRKQRIDQIFELGDYDEKWRNLNKSQKENIKENEEQKAISDRFRWMNYQDDRVAKLVGSMLHPNPENRIKIDLVIISCLELQRRKSLPPNELKELPFQLSKMSESVGLKKKYEQKKKEKQQKLLLENIRVVEEGQLKNIKGNSGTVIIKKAFCNFDESDILKQNGDSIQYFSEFKFKDQIFVSPIYQESLFDFINKTTHLGNSQSVVLLKLKIIKEIAQAIQQLHSQQIYHCEINPITIFRCPQTSKFKIQMIPNYSFVEQKWFQIKGKFSVENLKTWYKQSFQSPDQFNNPKMRAPQFDLWSLGCIVHNLMTGKNFFIFKEENMSLIKQFYNISLKSIWNRCQKKKEISQNDPGFQINETYEHRFKILSKIRSESLFDLIDYLMHKNQEQQTNIDQAIKFIESIEKEFQLIFQTNFILK